MKKVENKSTIPEKDYMSFTEEERAAHPVKTFGWKHEGQGGPLYVQFEAMEYDDFFNQDQHVMRNFQDSDQLIADDSGRYYAVWCSWSMAKKAAKHFKVKIEQH